MKNNNFSSFLACSFLKQKGMLMQLKEDICPLRMCSRVWVLILQTSICLIFIVGVLVTPKLSMFCGFLVASILISSFNKPWKVYVHGSSQSALSDQHSEPSGAGKKKCSRAPNNAVWYLLLL